MIHPDMHAALAFERQRMLLAEATADRLARQARPRQRQRRRGTLGWLSPAWSRLVTRTS